MAEKLLVFGKYREDKVGYYNDAQFRKTSEKFRPISFEGSDDEDPMIIESKHTVRKRTGIGSIPELVPDCLPEGKYLGKERDGHHKDPTTGRRAAF